MKELYRYILEQTTTGSIDKKSAAELIKMLKKEKSNSHDIAIVGISLKLPMADSLDEYWSLLSNSVNCIRDLPDNRKKDIDDYINYSDAFGEEARYVKGGYLDSIDKFDYEFFKLTPKEASLMEPCQRLFLETAFESIEDAGYSEKDIRGSNTGVYVGFANTLKDSYQKMIFDVEKESVSQSIASTLGAIVPSRLSYIYDLVGPSMVVDTACSSSLVAVHLACKAILNGECDQAIAGGVKLHTVPIDAEFSRMGIESSDGYTRAFDDSADGAGIGEGIVSIVLKPLNKAIADNNNIYAVIKGSAVNQDGSSMGITAPNPRAQTNVIVKAWKDAGINPEDIQYIETHGTGTKLGDPIEIEGLNKAFGKFTNRKQFCAIGSVKSNIGHTYECSGLASLVKVVMSLNKKKMLSSIHYEKPNQNINFLNSAVYVNTKLRDWKSDKKRLCGVNSFGFSGTNCHMVLEEAPLIEQEEVIDGINLLTLSAQNRDSLRGLVGKYIEYLKDKTEKDIHNICYTSNVGRGQYSNRLCIIFEDINELRMKLTNIFEREDFLEDEVYFGEHKIVNSNYVNIEANRISETLKKKYTDEAENIMSQVSNYTDLKKLLEDLCQLYIKGADLDWAKIYLETENKIVSVPTYQFDLKRCWLNVPKIDCDDDKLGIYNIEWIRSKDKPLVISGFTIDSDMTVVIENNDLGKKLVEDLRVNNKNIVHVEVTDKYEKLDENNYTVANNYTDLWKNFEAVNRIKIIYMYDNVSEEYKINEEYERLKNYFYLLSSLKEIQNKEISIDTVLSYVSKIQSNDYCNPTNTAIKGMIDSLSIELSNVENKLIDIDKNVNVKLLLSKLIDKNRSKIVACRENKELDIKSHGVYVISGGLGEIAVEIMKGISEDKKVNFALLCNTALPSRSTWQDYIKKNNDKTANRIKSVLDIEKLGSAVEIYKCNITNANEVKECVEDIRNKYTKINGIIHSAGIAGNNLFMAEDMNSFEKVVKPKILGAWNLDFYTKDDNLDFFVMFSSIATIMPAPGQFSYVAANSYLDGFVDFRNYFRNNTYVINWTTWKEVGMAKRTNVNVDTAFKTLATKDGVDGFKKVLQQDIHKAVIGNINYSEKYVSAWRNLNLKLSDSIERKIKLLENSMNQAKDKKIVIQDIEVENFELLGRENNNYSETEIEIGNMLSRLLGFSKMYIYDNLFEVGIDSIIMVKVANEILKKWGITIELSRFIEGVSIEMLAKEIDDAKENSIMEINKCSSIENNNEEEFDLTEVQSAYFMGRKDIFDIGNISTHAYVEIETELDIDKLNKAFNKVIRKHDMLRAIINEKGKQKILSNVPEYVIECEVNTDVNSRVLELRDKMSHRIFDTAAWPLFEIKALELEDNKKLLLLDFDMLIADAASLQIILNDWIDFYNDDTLEVKKFDYTFKNYISDYKALKKSDLYKRDKKYWLDKLEEFPSAPVLPMLKQADELEDVHFNRVEFELSNKEWKSIKEVAKENSLTASSLICAIYCEVLAQYSNKNRFALNLATFNRYPFNKDVEHLVGDFTSVVLLDVDLKQGDSLISHGMTIQKTLMEALDHRHYEGVEFLREYANARKLGTSASMPIVFTSMIYGEENDCYNLLGERKYGISQTSQVYIDCQVTNAAGGLSVLWDYVEDLFDEDIINEMFNTMKFMLTQISRKEVINLSSIKLKNSEIYNIYNNTKENIQETTLIDLFNKQAALNPEEIAVKHNGESIKYKELNEKSNKVAKYLIENGIKRGDYVAVDAKRCIDTIINVIAILKVGGSYIPVDPSYPDDRKKYILENSNAKYFLESDIYTKADIEKYSPNDIETVSEPDDTAYVIYTSGSTGKPKGVEISNKSAVNTIVDINNKNNVSKEDNIIAISSMCFDLSVYDIFGSLISGATLVLIDDQRDIKDICDVLIKEKITIWNSVPSIMELCVTKMDEINVKCNLRTVLLSGDWIPLNLFEKIKKHTSDNVEVISLGGATEGTIWSIYYPIKEVKDSWTSIPYGYPLANQEFYVLNDNRELCPLGVEGELYIGGKGVAKGYLNNEELTNNAFIEDEVLGRIYKTGDYGAMHKEDGKYVIEFRGRKDFQVKIRGFRIELGEIEKVILTDKNVKSVVVTDVKDNKGIKYLCAYVVCSGVLNKEDIRTKLKQNLPDYMIPQQIIEIDAIPLTVNGKVDRSKLPVPEMNSNHKIKVLEDDVERKLVDIFSEVLEMDNIGLEDDFYDLGLSSILMIRLVDKISAEFNDIELKFKELLETNNIYEISELIKCKKNEKMDLNEKEESEDEIDNIYYWSQVKQWKLKDNKIYINDVLYSDLNVEDFIILYSLAQEGINKQKLLDSNISNKEHVDEIMKDLISKGILIDSVLSYQEIFNNLKVPFDNKYGEEIIVDKVKNEEFKKEQLTRCIEAGYDNQIPLNNDISYPEVITNRHSIRKFNEEKLISYNDFSKMISVFKQINEEDKTRYYYASAGGLYPIDIYLYIKKNRVENLEEGIYYYNPQNNSLQIVNSKATIFNKSYYYSNKEIFDSSAFSIFMIYNAKANMPKYKSLGYLYAAIDAGIMVSLFTNIAESLETGVCSIGDLKFNEIRNEFKLNKDQVWLHTIEVGLK